MAQAPGAERAAPLCRAYRMATIHEEGGSTYRAALSPGCRFQHSSLHGSSPRLPGAGPSAVRDDRAWTSRHPAATTPDRQGCKRRPSSTSRKSHSAHLQSESARRIGARVPSAAGARGRSPEERPAASTESSTAGPGSPERATLRQPLHRHVMAAIRWCEPPFGVAPIGGDWRSPPTPPAALSLTARRISPALP